MAHQPVPLSRQRALIKTKITTIQNALTQGKIDQCEASLRLVRVSELFNQYDQAIDELELAETHDEEIAHAEGVRDRYYELSSHIETIKQANSSSNTTNNVTISNTEPSGAIIEKQRLAKLPATDLPKFDGRFENWLSFKNTFKNLIDSRKDIDELNKFIYLRGTLVGAAEHKLDQYNASTENYDQAWEHLTKIYQKERILVAIHCDAILNIPAISNPTHENLTKLVDTVLQHVNNLKSLDVNLNDAYLVRSLECKLPPEIRNKWEEQQSDDKIIPTLDKFCDFVNRIAFLASLRKQEQSYSVNHIQKRGRVDHREGIHKFRKQNSGTRVLMTSPSLICVHCKDNHPLYKCPSFNTLTIDQRVKIVKSLKLCRNCLREHKGICTSIRCRICNRFHHTMLHLKSTSTQQTSNRHSETDSGSKPDLAKTSTTNETKTTI